MYCKVKINRAIKPIVDIKNTQTFFILNCTKADTNTRILKITIVEIQTPKVSPGYGGAILITGPKPIRVTNINIIPCTKYTADLNNQNTCSLQSRSLVKQSLFP